MSQEKRPGSRDVLFTRTSSPTITRLNEKILSASEAAETLLSGQEYRVIYHTEKGSVLMMGEMMFRVRE